MAIETAIRQQQRVESKCQAFLVLRSYRAIAFVQNKNKTILLVFAVFSSSSSSSSLKGPLLPFDGLICKRTNLFIYCVYELCATAATVVSVLLLAAAVAFAALSRRKWHFNRVFRRNKMLLNWIYLCGKQHARALKYCKYWHTNKIIH